MNNACVAKLFSLIFNDGMRFLICNVAGELVTFQELAGDSKILALLNRYCS